MDMKSLVSEIHGELERHGVYCTEDNPCACLVVAEDALPKGWVRIYDDYASTCGPADEILAALQSANGTGYDPFWNAVAEFDGNEYDGLNRLAVKVATLCDDEGTPWEEVYGIETNGGMRYAWIYADPDANDRPAFNSHDEPFDFLAAAITASLNARL